MDRATHQALVRCLHAVLYGGQSFRSVLQTIREQESHLHIAELQALAYGVLRHYQQLSGLLKQLLDKPLKAKNREIQTLLLIALYRLSRASDPDYAVVNETVKLVKKGKIKWAANLVNGVLRTFCRQKQQSDYHLPQCTELPNWISRKIREDWPQASEQVIKQSNQQAPLVLRVNQQKYTTDHYQQLLAKAGIVAHKSPWVESALVLESARAVEDLPGFDQGACSVQDSAAQLAAFLLDAKDNEQVLDACAAPGGKSGHILERAPLCKLTAVDIDGRRLSKIAENLNRLGLVATIIQADLQHKNSFEPSAFDRILLDAPCSALGIIRRHPDIKFLRKAEDIEPLVQLQQKILHNCWYWLKPGGVLLYATCSILRQENEQQIKNFLRHETSAQLLDTGYKALSATDTGLQILPGTAEMDGFYYAGLLKADS